MEIKIKFTTSQAWAALKKQLEPIVVVFFGLLGAGWLVALFAAMNLWLGYGDNEPGWIVIWVIVTGAWCGLLFYFDK